VLTSRQHSDILKIVKEREMMLVKKNNIKVEGHVGTWYVVDEVYYEGAMYFLLEHEYYGEDTAWIAVDEAGDIVLEGIRNGAKELIEYLTPYVVIKFFMSGDETGQVYTTEFKCEMDYDKWFDHMRGSIELIDEKF
jgi:hypothetical protein